MKPGTKTIQVLESIGLSTSYADMGAATGFPRLHLTNIVAKLKQRKLVARVNPVGTNEAALFRITAAGVDELCRSTDQPRVGESMVERAVRARPALATVWAGA